jgi:hypothetical protein
MSDNPLDCVLANLLEQRDALCQQLRSDAKRSDFTECWNLLDEIADHDRRIDVLRKILSSEPGAGLRLVPKD